DPRQWRDDDGAGFRLPPRVDDRTAIAADVLAIPHPRFRIDRLTDGPEEPEPRKIVLRRPVVAPFHESANGSRCRVKNRDRVSLTDVPEAIALRPVRRAFVHHARRSVRERPVHEVRVTGYPTDVRGAPEDVLVLEIEHHSRRRFDAGEIT